MAWVKESITREDQSVRGIIIALDDDLRIRRALQMVNGVDFYRYEVKFSLNKVQAS
jgi:restriction system protein